MFALSDSERLKLNSDSNAPVLCNMIDRDNGHSKDGCFIVLPKHAPVLSIRSSMDMPFLFDLVNSILSEVLAPCVDVHPWVQPSRHCVAFWGPEGPVEKVWQTIVRLQEDCVTRHPDEMVLDTNWLEVGTDINMVGKQIARMLHGDLLEEVIVDFLG
ncbi:Phosphatidylinositol N-acetyglucosaminlytransferase subunit P-related [Zea mays]|uniref:Phosphatidylinositol N-acetyglucosaminlytransferase subunit P-related n=1 Tax=Zea mays TaxID=4577 RepID=A0A1D6IX78_MAIZE|nr:Phosphatidylinositol N-acetyglucosaminlytransferase subunit P-related [Zea mays]